MFAIPRFRPSVSHREVLSFLAAAALLRRHAVDACERDFARRLLGGGRVVLAPSARVALCWLLEALDLAPGDEVVTQAFNFPAVPAAIRAAGGRPRFLDLAPGSFEADWRRLDDLLGPRTRVVVVTHLYGNPADLAAAAARCADRGVTLVEDCAQGIGAAAGGRPVGTTGRGAIFSLGPTKNLTLLGGGAVACRDEGLARRLEALAARHGKVRPLASLALMVKAAALGVATHPLPFSLALLPLLRLAERRGVDLVHQIMEEPPGVIGDPIRARRPSAAMAAVGLAQLGRVDALNRARVRNGWYLRSRLAGVERLTLPPLREGCVFMSFPVLHPEREVLARALRDRGVDSDLGFMADCSSLPLFAEDGASCPHSARTAREILHLPIYPQLEPRHLDRVATAVRAALDGV